ncbi:hypothetical protein DFH08DRAFT_823695 [Mycena albidolilacea]|uniref:Uncharacterized protein n=1 Tax=Mycena albidolilacea TaxID=1033008 RepID=A0AAD6Z6L0_9AGAR|nr:hypothetical protein DFH08DRAFT_823695 [Mycena albidolilacea]
MGCGEDVQRPRPQVGRSRGWGSDMDHVIDGCSSVVRLGDGVCRGEREGERSRQGEGGREGGQCTTSQVSTCRMSSVVPRQGKGKGAREKKAEGQWGWDAATLESGILALRVWVWRRIRQAQYRQCPSHVPIFTSPLFLSSSFSPTIHPTCQQKCGREDYTYVPAILNPVPGPWDLTRSECAIGGTREVLPHARGKRKDVLGGRQRRLACEANEEKEREGQQLGQ